jgi:hypothetical protein
MHQLIAIIFICFPLWFLCQAPPKKNARITIRGDVGIPRAIASQMFRTAFNGVVESGLSVNLRAFNNFYCGLGYRYVNFLNNKQLFAFYKTAAGSLSYNTRMLGNSGFVKLGYDYFFSDIGYVSCAINTGYMVASYEKLNPDTSLANQPIPAAKFTAPYVQPEFSVNFLAEKHVSFSILLSYTTIFYKFDPKAPRFNHISEIASARNSAVMGWLNIGFGFNILID